MQDKPDMLPKATQEDIDVLAKPDASQHESAWTTFRNLPKSHRWPYFYRHFFWPIIIGVVVLAAAIAFIVNMAVTPKGQGLGVAVIDLEESSQQMDGLEDGYEHYRQVNKDLVTFENDFYLDSNNHVSAGNSQETFDVQLSGGTLNTLISTKAGLESKDVRDYVEPLADVLTPHQLGVLRDRGAIVELPLGKDGAARQVALDLGKSDAWRQHADGGTDALLAFVNVQNKQYVRLFVDYLYGM
ncbi:hypothetical protein PG1550B_1603 [Bifidobacterium pseudolongum subsp. globosum]|uniref:Membrane protein n=1 Tax=Bifidobacterium pseudolongum PV8-2 TaxID=1447715 RepID=A0A0A7I9F1_9BIFI|nr:hypothetical protein [Bifidobacterium pseudolongum]AIZ16877.1 membrane protein [Bifidobacterium pseudolongum PV8-2]MCH4852146.1 hypothetical protein [Bifidobacterium pseudolongum]PKU98967.1 hypothetical protein CQR54_1583 [Bifidobacterium pseudolongum subsp. globosum]RYQ57953.1 hypothetical protein PG1550B_1603 [Bifidobacterium pseudolongum subsp. globosum]RYQ71341.1 hypothetical protein PG2012B_1678 [Bifidobacterium pseudolongum subsp. globosum]